MTKIEKLTNMAEYSSNRLLAELSNEIYHNFQDELDEFKMLQAEITEYINIAKNKYIRYMTQQITKQEEDDKLAKISEQLEQWRFERHLTTDSQKKNLIGNILEELTEFSRAQNDEEKIDSLCDICVFAINSYNQSLDKRETTEIVNADKDLNLFTREILCYLEIGDIDRLVFLCFSNMRILGYDPYLCMDETIKEISSRTGHYDEDIGKFVKDLGFYTLEDAQLTYPNYKVTEEPTRFRVDMGEEVDYKPKWYKADYSKCKLKEGKE